jgi:hypothetical protein
MASEPTKIPIDEDKERQLYRKRLVYAKLFASIYLDISIL